MRKVSGVLEEAEGFFSFRDQMFPAGSCEPAWDERGARGTWGTPDRGPREGRAAVIGGGWLLPRQMALVAGRARFFLAGAIGAIEDAPECFIVGSALAFGICAE